MTFNRHTGTGLESQNMAYMPEGKSPYAVLYPDGDTILLNGDNVQVLSVWDRDHYLPGEVLLAYVHCYTSGESTHVAITDLVDPLTLQRVAYQVRDN